jgi:hypothetical protein
MKALIILFLSISLFSYGQKCKTSVVVDKFEGTKSFFVKGYNESMFTFLKEVDKNGDTAYFIKTSALSKDPHINEKGLFVIFKDGTVFNRPDAKVDCKPYVSGYYNGFVLVAFDKISKEELTMFCEKQVSDYKVYISIQEVNDRFGKYVLKDANCVLTAN